MVSSLQQLILFSHKMTHFIDVHKKCFPGKSLKQWLGYIFYYFIIIFFLYWIQNWDNPIPQNADFTF